MVFVVVTAVPLSMEESLWKESDVRKETCEYGAERRERPGPDAEKDDSEKE
jgi:hypothetical protein